MYGMLLRVSVDRHRSRICSFVLLGVSSTGSTDAHAELFFFRFIHICQAVRLVAPVEVARYTLRRRRMQWSGHITIKAKEVTRGQYLYEFLRPCEKLFEERLVD